MYSNKDKDWLSQSFEQIKSDFKQIVKPSSNTNTAPAPAKPSTIKEKKVSTTVKTTQTQSFAFDHLSNNVNCESTTNIIEQSICADVDLSDQDKRLNFILKKWENANKTSAHPILKQVDWITLRAQTCSKITKSSLKHCIQTITEQRIQAITGQI
ncbi:MAG: lysozyme inhibitor LprI family protein [Pseudomonadales bacterium]|nr:lysozyme inhibitor LprI family protein [Pseudomonadales bacterium]